MRKNKIMGFDTLFKLNMFFVNIAGYIRTVQYYLFEHYKFNVVKKNKELKGPKEKVCYICALGPSLKKVDLNKIIGDTIVVNRFHKLSNQYPNFIPTYYLMYDASFGSTYKDELIEAIDKYYSKGTKFLFNSRFAKLDFLKQDNIYYLSSFKGDFTGQEYRLDSVMPSFSNVVGAAIGTAMGMGYKKIVLLGCDFNSFASPVSNHCYAEADNSRQIKLWYELYRYAIVAYGHEMLSKYARLHNIEIINSTKGSLIDSYPFEIQEYLYND